MKNLTPSKQLNWLKENNIKVSSIEEMNNLKSLYVFPNLNWKDIKWINKILKDELTAEEVFAIDNIEHRRVAYEYMDKLKMKELKDYKILDEVKDDGYGNIMKIVSFTVQQMKEPLKFLNCFCSSSRREFFIQTEQDKCWEAKSQSFGELSEKIKWIKEW